MDDFYLQLFDLLRKCRLSKMKLNGTHIAGFKSYNIE